MFGKILKNEDGAALVLSLIIILVLIVLIGALANSINNNIGFTKRHEDTTKAFYAAEAGIEYAVNIMINDRSSLEHLVEDEFNVIADSSNYIFESIEGKIFGSNGFTFKSTGKNNDIEKSITASYNITVLPYGLTGDIIDIGNNHYIDGDVGYKTSFDSGNNYKIDGEELQIDPDTSEFEEFVSENYFYPILRNGTEYRTGEYGRYDGNESLEGESFDGDYYKEDPDDEDEESYYRKYIEDYDTNYNGNTPANKFPSLNSLGLSYMDIRDETTKIYGDLSLDGDINGSGTLIVYGNLGFGNNFKINQDGEDFFKILVKGNIYQDQANLNEIKGFVYAEGDIIIRNRFFIEGALYSGGNITLGQSNNTDEANIIYNPEAFEILFDGYTGPSYITIRNWQEQ